jgi:hypothetical protein
MSRYIVTMPSSGNEPCMEEQILSAPPVTAVRSAIIAKVGAAARHSQSAMPAALPPRGAPAGALPFVRLPFGTGVSGLESDGGDQFFCGGGSSGKVRAVRRPK